MSILIEHGTIVNEFRRTAGFIVVEGEQIKEIGQGEYHGHFDFDERIDAKGGLVMPGVIDTHVHFREPGLTHKADLETESRAAAYGGVTTFFDMPNVVPQTVTIEALHLKHMLAREKSHVNYAFFIGATNDNMGEIMNANPYEVPGVKLFMGASTGNMLVNRRETLEEIFANVRLPIMAHCEDTLLISQNMREAQNLYGDDPNVALHSKIRSAEACVRSSKMAMEMARKYHADFHLAHVSTSEEIQWFDPLKDEQKVPKITAEVAVPHLWFSDDDYATSGTRIKCNPAVKTNNDREALRRALAEGRAYTIATDHAPHLMSEKNGGCRKAASGMPMVQFSLLAMLQLCQQGYMSVERMVSLMCHHPALRFGVNRRGFLRVGYQADIVVARQTDDWTPSTADIQSKCGWSPMEGQTFSWKVCHTICNGHHLLNEQKFDATTRGQAVKFRIND